MLNKVLLIGNLGKDPQVFNTEAGITICSFSLATTEKFTDKSGKKQTKTEWHNIKTFGKLAEICSQYLLKGKQVYIEGRISTNEWTDSDGNKKSIKEIIANQMIMLSSRANVEHVADVPDYQQQTQEKQVDDSDLPF